MNGIEKQPRSKQRIAPISYSRLFPRPRWGVEDVFKKNLANFVGPDSHIIPLGRARAGIYLLAAYAIKDDRCKVIMSPYTIPDVAMMVRLAGGEPVFYDFISDSSSCDVAHVEQLIDDRTACVLLTHYHVNEPNFVALRTLCEQRNVPLFDDCALTFGGELEGRPFGMLTDASVFSFSSFKTLNYFWGGVIVTRHRELAETLESLVDRWARMGWRAYFQPAKACLRFDAASRPFLFKHLVFPMLRKRAMLSNEVRSLENVRVETDFLDDTIQSRPALAAFAEWNDKLKDISGIVARRRHIARIYAELHGDRMVSAKFVTGETWSGSCFVNFPILVPKGQRDRIVREMMSKGFDIGRNLYLNVHKHQVFIGSEGRSDNVQRIVDDVIYLPTHFAISEPYAARISQSLERCLSDAGAFDIQMSAR